MGLRNLHGGNPHHIMGIKGGSRQNAYVSFGNPWKIHDPEGCIRRTLQQQV